MYAAVDPQAHQVGSAARCDDREIASHHRVLVFGLEEPYRPRKRHEGHHHSHHHHGRHGHHSHHHHHHQRGRTHGSHSKSGKEGRARHRLTVEGQDSSPLGSDASPNEPPSERVKFIIGEDNDMNDTPTVFTELEELCENKDHKLEWKETARWIKFEEDVEHAGDKWSKPHVATLSLHSLFELRHCILKGNVILDLEATNLEQITDVILDHMVASRQLEEIHRHRVLETILLKHRHYGDHHHSHHHKGILQAIKGSFGRHLDELDQGNSRTGSHASLTGTSGENAGDHADKGDGHSRNMSSASGLTHQAKEPSLMKKIPPGSEASNVLVGELNFLTEPLIAFVRLHDAVTLGDLTEIPLPTRFIFLLLGPLGSQQANHEVGRSISTLMSDPLFHDVAYKAKSREDVLAGIDLFLDQVVVLPPGEWDPTIRIEPPKQLPSAEERKKSFCHPPMPSAIDQPKHHAPTGHKRSGSNAGAGGEDGGGDGNVTTARVGDGGNNNQEDHADPTLKKTGRLFGGLIADVRRKAKFYKSDFADIFNLQIISSIIFIYFAVISPAITFGGLLGDKTDNHQAAFESVLSVSITGIVWSFAGGQPIIKLGPTGPMLIFEEILYDFCNGREGLDYLAFRFWIGVWTTLFCLILVATDASVLVRYVTRFTEETFSVLISVIFIYEALKKLAEISSKYSSAPCLNCVCNCTVNGTTVNGTTMNGFVVAMFPMQTANASCNDFGTMNNLTTTSVCPEITGFREVFFLSVILMFGTFFLALYLKGFKQTSYLPARARQIVSDYAVVVAVIFWIVIDVAFSVDTPKLSVPDKFQPTRNDREFVISPVPSGFPAWAPFAAILPALLVTILLFMDQQITGIIVNRKENKMKKGAGYHLDLFIVCILFFICSLLGLPWVVAATVQSITHVNSLQVFSKTQAPGEQPKFLGIREQRVTSLVVSILAGVSLLMTPLLNIIPMPVLYGLFLYMGVASLQVC
ncbi:sodium-driven chloride bicarbonate exchanger-like isoform X2 [Corticium candelabrum]|uniref:sodium-driven chloride bicarbonate exchanger-like isoform X2 n=1 Tax=Corticium candelabrum TaxID=121492 RepID=UPI002E26B621|nr:sodium-driven chloride bicarbonate exchanger-like isoform X2 [Corticium candelabrum]